LNILLTGSSGWLGRFLAPMLKARGHGVIGLDVAPGAYTDAIGSVADAHCVDTLFADNAIDAVIHSGALHKPDIARYPAQSFVDVNVTGTLNLLGAAARAGHRRFVFTSTTSLMISQAIRDEAADHAIWLDERTAPLEPRNIYGVTKLAAEQLCRLFAADNGMDIAILRTSRFFPEDDDTHAQPGGENLKSVELLYRRLTVEDAAMAHVVALESPHLKGCQTYIVSAPTPFARADAQALKTDAARVIRRLFPKAEAQFAQAGWVLPAQIGRVYDASRIGRELGFCCTTSFADVLAALEAGRALPFVHDPAYVSPIITQSAPLFP
jgi:UDP-glucose 4-epimerase